MKPFLVIFKGVQFPYYLMEYVLVLARKKSRSVHVLFLTASQSAHETFGYPDDPLEAEKETRLKTVYNDNVKIIKDHMQLATDMAIFEEVNCTIDLIDDCTLDQMIQMTLVYDHVFIDEDFDKYHPNFTMTELVKAAPYKVLTVSAETEIPLK